MRNLCSSTQSNCLEENFTQQLLKQRHASSLEKIHASLSLIDDLYDNDQIIQAFSNIKKVKQRITLIDIILKQRDENLDNEEKQQINQMKQILNRAKDKFHGDNQQKETFLRLNPLTFDALSQIQSLTHLPVIKDSALQGPNTTPQNKAAQNLNKMNFSQQNKQIGTDEIQQTAQSQSLNVQSDEQAAYNMKKVSFDDVSQQNSTLGDLASLNAIDYSQGTKSTDMSRNSPISSPLRKKSQQAIQIKSSNQIQLDLLSRDVSSPKVQEIMNTNFKEYQVNTYNNSPSPLRSKNNTQGDAAQTFNRRNTLNRSTLMENNFREMAELRMKRRATMIQTSFTDFSHLLPTPEAKVEGEEKVPSENDDKSNKPVQQQNQLVKSSLQDISNFDNTDVEVTYLDEDLNKIAAQHKASLPDLNQQTVLQRKESSAKNYLLQKSCKSSSNLQNELNYANLIKISQDHLVNHNKYVLNTEQDQSKSKQYLKMRNTRHYIDSLQRQRQLPQNNSLVHKYFETAKSLLQSGINDPTKLNKLIIENHYKIQIVNNNLLKKNSLLQRQKTANSPLKQQPLNFFEIN